MQYQSQKKLRVQSSPKQSHQLKIVKTSLKELKSLKTNREDSARASTLSASAFKTAAVVLNRPNNKMTTTTEAMPN